jgi:hypothetical protein
MLRGISGPEKQMEGLGEHDAGRISRRTKEKFKLYIGIT